MSAIPAEDRRGNGVHGELPFSAEVLANSAREPLLVLDHKLRVCFANRPFYNLFQVNAAETLDRLIYEIGNRQWEIPSLRQLLEQLLLAGPVVHDYEVEHDFPQIGKRIMLLNAHRIEGQGPASILLAIEDITVRKMVERTAARYASELERSNRELEEFAAVASHDLQEPLRKITAFGERLHSRAGAALDAQASDYLQRMLSAASRMSLLIESLLQLSRVARRQLDVTKVDLSVVVAEAVSDLDEQVRRSAGQVLTENLPTVQADRLQMRQLFQNLISNALKFHKPDEAPVVRVRAREIAPQQYEITVSDNGIGFDEKYVDRIFRPFQRLHGRSEYEGSGIGLAVCRRIVERHGGSIGVTAVPGEGSAFHIELSSVPKIKEALS